VADDRRVLEYRPPFAEHVVGSYPERRWDPQANGWEEQKIAIRCETCGESTQRACSSGMAREHVSRFAILHLHRDPFSPPPARTR
jgi:hypothetical protein